VRAHAGAVLVRVGYGDYRFVLDACRRMRIPAVKPLTAVDTMNWERYMPVFAHASRNGSALVVSKLSNLTNISCLSCLVL
jgi:hypothetical protein